MPDPTLRAMQSSFNARHWSENSHLSWEMNIEQSACKMSEKDDSLVVVCLIDSGVEAARSLLLLRVAASQPLKKEL